MNQNKHIFTNTIYAKFYLYSDCISFELIFKLCSTLLFDLSIKKLCLVKISIWIWNMCVIYMLILFSFSDLFEPKVCPKCHKIFKNKTTLSKHLRLQCGTEAKYTCSYCGKKFKRNDNMKRHIQHVHTRRYSLSYLSNTNRCDAQFDL